MFVRQSIAAVMISVCVGIVVLATYRVNSTEQDNESPTRVDTGTLSQADALELAKDELGHFLDSPAFVISEARLTTMGQFESISGSPDGVPDSGTNRSLGTQGVPVWVVVLGVTENLSHTEFVPAGDDMRQYYLGEAGDRFVWPDGTTRAVMVFDANTGDLAESLILSPRYSYVHDKIIALP